MKSTLRVALAVAGTLLTSAAAFADYPDRPIQVIVGFSAGGAMDATIRTVAPTLQKILGQPVVVINKPGAGGAVAWTEVARSKPDGYTLGSVNYPAISGVTASGGLPIDPLKSFDFLGNVMVDPAIVVVPAKSPYKSLGDVVTYLKAHPGGLSYGATGSTSLDGLVSLALAAKADAKFRVVNFAGTPEAVTALLGGHIDALGLAVSEVLPLMQEGSVRILGVGGDKRNPLIPDVPTFKEQGFDLPISASSRGMIAPAGMDPAVLKKLRDAIKQATEDPEYVERAKKVSQRVSYSSPEEVRDVVTKQIEFLSQSLPKK
ncbi:Bug family tripartite tricarboxylate transporter substrate binding protein [Ancylobacter mangrovi]|uniref:Bug family tripartite tricarboxylate transporter substrate binding protein n=1 Tax=Ancylobacter mangrovi TaxID=2972472 RepID=UPI002163126E|nr:tripartite tricarboxylate transporter substrate binding protein [Ancylobacter mangrovi]MCS0505013.1 tripartite tricarboxylate transporter substrate binding protein [Ancylobacter mangrovi]